jgi:hypothetical protein
MERKIPQAKACAPCIFAICVLFALPACGPDMNAVANRLREQTIKQDREIADLKAKLARSEATATQMRGQLDARYPRVDTLPQARLDALYTPVKVQIRPATDSWEFENGKGLAGFRVYFRTLAEDGTILPATGDVQIEALELPPAPAPPRRLGTWNFTAADVKKAWYSGMGLNQFALNCPWQTPPAAADVTFRLRFTDALTGRVLEAKLDKKVTLPTGSAAKAAATQQK